MKGGLNVLLMNTMYLQYPIFSESYQAVKHTKDFSSILGCILASNFNLSLEI